MQINNNSRTNFKATRILTARKILPQKTHDVIEVFRINKKQDIDFIKKCNTLLAKNKKMTLNIFEKRLKALLKDLESQVKPYSEEFYLAIKNGEIIEGCANAMPILKDIMPVNIFMRKMTSENINLLFYAMVKDFQKNYSNYKLNLKFLLTDTIADEKMIKSTKWNTLTEKIKQEYPKVKFRTENKQNINLDDVLGVRDFEAEYYPNLR